MTYTRREFGKLAAGGAAAAAAAGIIAPRPARAQRAPALPWPQFSHVVVLMFENRSFDTFLGMVPGTDGPAGHTNPVPDQATHKPAGPPVIAAWPTTTGATPVEDPGEEYQHVNTQLWNTIDPAGNWAKDYKAMAAPYNLPSGTPLPTPTMDGFVTDFISNWTATHNGTQPTVDQYREIMAYFDEQTLPNFHTLAREFAVFDHWFCAVPSQTMPNRSFFNAASSSGFVVNEPYTQFPLHNTAKTIFTHLSDHGQTWGVFYDWREAYSLTKIIHQRDLGTWFRTFHYMEDFYHRVRTGTLPTYSFVEPRMLTFHNDAHPPASVVPADALVGEVYQAIRNSTSTTGSNWQNTLLIITFDEHGGTWDHVPPPGGTIATPPGPETEQMPFQYGFPFDRLGVRVPTIVVSPYIERGTVVSAQYTHTSVIRTICQQWGLTNLTNRDLHSPDLGPVLTRTQPRDRSSLPDLSSSTSTLATSAGAWNLDAPLNDLQRTVVNCVGVLANQPVPEDVDTVSEARAFIAAHQEALGLDNRVYTLPVISHRSTSGW